MFRMIPNKRPVHTPGITILTEDELKLQTSVTGNVLAVIQEKYFLYQYVAPARHLRLQSFAVRTNDIENISFIVQQ